MAKRHKQVWSRITLPLSLAQTLEIHPFQILLLMVVCAMNKNFFFIHAMDQTLEFRIRAIQLVDLKRWLNLTVR